MRYAFLEGLRGSVECDVTDGDQDGHVIVVFTRPTFASSDILAKSVAKSGVSCIFSRNAFEHRGESISACTYKSRNVTVPRPSSLDDDGGHNGSVKTRSSAAKM